MSFWTMAGFFIALSSPIIAALIQEKVDPLFIGRIFSVFGLIQLVSLPLGMLLFGPLSDQVDISNIILIAGCIMVVLAIIPLSMKNFLKHGLKDNPSLKGEHIA
jgi:DHA3 family macrolide efflux protein-like MFS transporter